MNFQQVSPFDLKSFWKYLW